jgi:hypothetical protein
MICDAVVAMFNPYDLRGSPVRMIPDSAVVPAGPQHSSLRSTPKYALKSAGRGKSAENRDLLLQGNMSGFSEKPPVTILRLRCLSATLL